MNDALKTPGRIREIHARAGRLYTTYNRVLNGGQEGGGFPAWEAVVTDPKKAAIADAWIATALSDVAVDEPAGTQVKGKPGRPKAAPAQTPQGAVATTGSTAPAVTGGGSGIELPGIAPAQG
jgi:hypothetical protein